MWKSSIKVRIRKRVYTEKYKNIRIQICYRLHSFSNHQCCGSEPGADHWFVKKKYYQKVHKIIKALRLENLFLKNFYNGLCKSISFSTEDFFVQVGSGFHLAKCYLRNKILIPNSDPQQRNSLYIVFLFFQWFIRLFLLSKFNKVFYKACHL